MPDNDLLNHGKGVLGNYEEQRTGLTILILRRKICVPKLGRYDERARTFD